MLEQKIDTLYKTIGSRINEARLKQGLSQPTLAKKTGVSRTSIVNIEQGRQRLPLHLLWQISEVLDIEPSSLIPSIHEVKQQPASILVNEDTLQIIEKKAQGNLDTRKKLLDFYLTAG